VLDFTWVWAGPYCTMQLAHFGADVIRVNLQRVCPLAFGDRSRQAAGHQSGGLLQSVQSGKPQYRARPIQPEAIELVYELIKHTDVVTETSRRA